MIFSEIDISSPTIEYFATNQKYFHDLDVCNGMLEKECGIKTFFEGTDQLNQFIK